MLRTLMSNYQTIGDAAFMSRFINVLSSENQYILKKDPFSYSENKLIIAKDTIITLDNNGKKAFLFDADVEISSNNLESGNFSVGNDYYIYLCDDSNDGELIISLNSSYPTGYNELNSRKIGGFHYGHIRKVSSDGMWIPIDSESTSFGTGAIIWKNNVTTGIVPNSVWDLKNRPNCRPEGMVKIGNFWCDIYNSSAVGTLTFEDDTLGEHIKTGDLRSMYGKVPVLGIQGINYFVASVLATRSSKSLPSLNQWVNSAYGSPGGLIDDNMYGNIIGGAIMRTGCNVDVNGNYIANGGEKAYAISAFNVVDCIGNVIEITNEIVTKWTHDDLPSNVFSHNYGINKGAVYHSSNSFASFIGCGGSSTWTNSAGSRSFHIGCSLDGLTVTRGVRLVCNN